MIEEVRKRARDLLFSLSRVSLSLTPSHLSGNHLFGKFRMVRRALLIVQLYIFFLAWKLF